MASEPASVEDITRQLMPKFSPSRSIGGVLKSSQEPSVTMRLQFRKNSYELTPKAVVQLQNLGKALQNEKLRGYVYKIEGHTCDLGSDAHNLELSRKRALSVQRYLSRTFGLPGEQFAAEGYGERQPLTPNTSESARKKNRRVVVKNTLQTFNINTTGSSGISVQMKRFRNNMEETVQNGDVLTQQDNYAIEFMPKKNKYACLYLSDGYKRQDD